MTDEAEEIWSAIKYLDPDEKHEENGAAIVISLALALLGCLIWVLVYLGR